MRLGPLHAGKERAKALGRVLPRVRPPLASFLLSRQALASHSRIWLLLPVGLPPMLRLGQEAEKWGEASCTDFKGLLFVSCPLTDTRGVVMYVI